MTSREEDIAKLSPEAKRKLLAKILRKKVTSITSTPPLKPISRDGALPLSFSQERLWFLSQLEPDNLAYNLSGGVRFKGRLRPDILERSLLEIVQRHEILRTTFNDEGGKPVQVVSATPNLEFQHVDLEEWPEGDRTAEVRRLAAQEARRPFNLLEGPLVRAVLVRLGKEEYVLIMLMHHIVTDGWSIGVFTHELESLYSAFSAGLPSPLSDLPIQYADYAAWQREWLQGGILETQLAYWKKQLSGNLPILQLPTDRPRPTVQTNNGSIQNFHLSEGILKKLRDLSFHHGVTLYVTLLAAFKTLLFRYTGQTDFAVGSPIANRNRSEVEGLIGLFVNNLVLRTNLSGDPVFTELMERVREVTLDAYAHQDVPFEKLVEVLNPARDMSHSPLFQVMFAFQNFSRPTLELQGLTLTSEMINVGASMFDLTVYMQEAEGGLSGIVEYNTDLFNPETIMRMIGQFEMLLESITRNPEQRISKLALLTAEERRKLLVEWNATRTQYPADKPLVNLFEEQVDRTPESTAVICAGKRLTYAQLNLRANQMAHHLRTLGAGPGSIIGICTDRSIDMVVGVLGILKTGGAYTPLDPHFPEDRIEFMLQDSSSGILITQSNIRERFGRFSGRIVCMDSDMDSDWEMISKEKYSNPTPLASPDDLAYVIYTSGSTGKPKGVQISHRALVNFLCSMRNEPGLTETDTLLSVTTMSFDIFGLELFLPLITGAKVVIAERDDTLDGSRLSKLLEEHKVSVMQATPSTWRLLIESGWSGGDALKVLCGGEAFPSELVGPLMERCAELWNLYGPTETTIWSTVYRIKSQQEIILIGRPIANTQIYILDSSLQPVPTGVVGELFIGGDGLARGYLNRPELTAEKFVAHPFREITGTRIYKTGDLARYRSDGEIECLGRIDHQVKLRGFRIELGEIEARIKDLKAIKNCVVVLREDRPGDQSLVAYFLARENCAVLLPDVRNHLQSMLPDYMVPQHFVELISIPLTPNGKVDRKALPEPDVDQAPKENYVAPQSETEQKVAGIWQEVLQLESVGIHDDFFELGGHSLLATKVISRINHLFDFQMPLRKLFETRTIGALANFIEAVLWATEGRQAKGPSQIEEREVIDI